MIVVNTVVGLLSSEPPNSIKVVVMDGYVIVEVVVTGRGGKTMTQGGMQ